MSTNESIPKQILQGRGPRLAQLVQRAASLDRLTRAVRASLPDALSPHCRGVALNKRTLTVFVDNSVWTTRVRFYQANVRNGLKRRFRLDVRRVKVRVMPPRFAAPAPRREPQKMSAATRDLIRTTADSVDDADLARALRRLGRDGR